MARDARALPSMAAWRIFLRAGRFRGVVAHSDVVAERLRHCGCPAHKVHKIPFGFDVPELPANGASPFPEHASPKILSVGGLVHHKGLHDLVRAMPGLRRSFPRAHLCIVGERRDKAYAAYLERLIARQRAQHCVSLLGDATEATKAAALRDADLYVQASHEEGFCLAFAEAAAIVPRLVGTRTGEIA